MLASLNTGHDPSFTGHLTGNCSRFNIISADTAVLDLKVKVERLGIHLIAVSHSKTLSMPISLKGLSNTP